MRTLELEFGGTRVKNLYRTELRDTNGKSWTLQELRDIHDRDIFFPIEDYPIYEVSHRGFVRSIERTIETEGRKPRIVEEKIWQGDLHKNTGYFQITLRNELGGKKIYIHQLMAIVFLGHIPNGMKMVVDHINSVKTYNHLDNIQVITHRENISRSIKNASSIYTGVSKLKGKEKWASSISIDKKRKHLGHFTDEKEAAIAYQFALMAYTGITFDPQMFETRKVA